MAKYYVKLKTCTGSGNSGPHFDQDLAIAAMKVSVLWRTNNLNETWCKTTETKWASTDGHTMEVLPYE